MENETIKSYKGFNKDLTCREHQYEVGKEYEYDGNVLVCYEGFHACENPFDVLIYYDMFDEHRFCEVEQSGIIDRDDQEPSIASSKIKINEEIGVIGLFKAAVDYLEKHEESFKSIDDETIANEIILTDECSRYQISTNKDYISISSNVFYTKIHSTGKHAKININSNFGQISSTDDYVNISASGSYVQIASKGRYAKINSSERSAKIAVVGNFATVSSCGDFAKIGSTGYADIISSSGNYTQIASSGNYSEIVTCGEYNKIISSGNFAKISSTGNYTKIISTGDNAVICCTGFKSSVKAKKGSLVTLSEWKYSEDQKCYVPIDMKTERVDGENIKEDTWYMLQDGEFVECELKKSEYADGSIFNYEMEYKEREGGFVV